MEIDDQKKTYDGFIKVTIKSTAIIIVVMLLLAAFVA